MMLMIYAGIYARTVPCPSFPDAATSNDELPMTRRIAYDKRRNRERHLIEDAFCRLKDFRRIATRYDKRARNFLSAIVLATLVAFWC